jgi:hypothetical protein
VGFAEVPVAGKIVVVDVAVVAGADAVVVGATVVMPGLVVA